MLGLGKGVIFNLPLFSKAGLTQVESGLAQGLDVERQVWIFLRFRLK